jgi:hypothetical protein
MNWQFESQVSRRAGESPQHHPMCSLRSSMHNKVGQCHVRFRHQNRDASERPRRLAVPNCSPRNFPISAAVMLPGSGPAAEVTRLSFVKRRSTAFVTRNAAIGILDSHCVGPPRECLASNVMTVTDCALGGGWLQILQVRPGDRNQARSRAWIHVARLRRRWTVLSTTYRRSHAYTLSAPRIPPAYKEMAQSSNPKMLRLNWIEGSEGSR